MTEKQIELRPGLESAVASYGMYPRWNEEKQTHETMCDMAFKDGTTLVFSMEAGAEIPAAVQGWPRRLLMEMGTNV